MVSICLNNIYRGFDGTGNRVSSVTKITFHTMRVLERWSYTLKDLNSFVFANSGARAPDVKGKDLVSLSNLTTLHERLSP